MYHALIRTHHITSCKKVATLKAAAKKHGCLALLRSGGTPGIMYVRSEEEERVKKWVEVVHVSVPIFTSLVDFLLRRGLKELGDWVLLIRRFQLQQRVPCWGEHFQFCRMLCFKTVHKIENDWLSSFCDSIPSATLADSICVCSETSDRFSESNSYTRKLWL